MKQIWEFLENRCSRSLDLHSSIYKPTDSLQLYIRYKLKVSQSFYKLSNYDKAKGTLKWAS